MIIVAAAAAVVHASMLDRGVTVTTESSEDRANNIVSYEFLWIDRTCDCI